MTVYGDNTESFFVTSGSYTINADRTVSIIAEEACRVSDIDKEAANRALAAAQVRLINSFSQNLTFVSGKGQQW